MPAMTISVNDKRICSVKLTRKNTRSVIISWLGEWDLSVHIGGMEGEKHAYWRTPKLKMGDEVKVKFVHAAKTDPPATRKTLEELMTPKERER
jgi:hypothetical protein